jgi:hypothetical protein
MMIFHIASAAPVDSLGAFQILERVRARPMNRRRD